MPEQDPPPIEPGRGRLRYDKARKTIVSELVSAPTKPTTSVDLRDLPLEQYELIAAMAVQTLCSIANYDDAETIRKNEELNDANCDVGRGYGLDPDEAIEMAYDNVLGAVRSALGRIAEKAAAARASR